MTLGQPDPNAQHPLLVTTQWLAEHLDDPGLVLIDAGEAVAYRRGHIERAVGVPHPYLKGATSPLHVMTASEFETFARGIGVSNDSEVVIYDDNASLYSARVWWVFQRYGHTRARVVDGGLNAWIEEGRPITSAPARPSEGSFTATEHPEVVCSVDELKGLVGGETQIWDARTDGEWEGTNDRGNKRAGHVPGAKHLEWIRLMQGPPERRFRPLDEIRSMLHEAGINPEAVTVTY